MIGLNKSMQFLMIGLFLFFGACGQKPPIGDKNIIIVVVDTLRRDRLGVHGNREEVTPCLNRLAREGICFQRAFAPSSWTKPSIASLFTGLYPGRHGVIGDMSIYQNLAFFDTEYKTLAEHLNEAGYQTAAFIYNANLIPLYHFDQGFDTFVQPAGLAEEIVERASKWIEEHKDQGKFFLYLHLIDPHAPYYAPGEYREKFARGNPGSRAAFARAGRSQGLELWAEQYFKWKPEDGGERFRFDFFTEKLEKKLAERRNNPTLDKIKSKLYLDFNGKDDPDFIQRKNYLTSLYDGEVFYADNALQTFCDFLEAENEMNKSVLILTSDHGEGFLEHHTWGHRYYVHGEEIDIPLVFRIPGPDGKAMQGEFNENVSLVDLYPTLLDMVGIPLPGDLGGESLWPLLQGGKAGRLQSRPVFCESFLQSGDHVSVVAGNKKMIRSAAGGKVAWKFYRAYA